MAQRVGKSPSAVRQRGYKLGVDASQALPPGELDSIRELNGEGLSDREIGELLGRPQRTIWRLRNEMGLPRRGRRLGERGPLSERHRERLQQSQRERVAVDPERFSEKVREHQRRHWGGFARKHGWPEELCPSSVLILNVLAATGVPLTAAQLYDVLHPGARAADAALWRRADMRQLLKARLVVRLPISAVGERGGSYRPGAYATTTSAYALSPLALSILRERAQCKSNDETPR